MEYNLRTINHETTKTMVDRLPSCQMHGVNLNALQYIAVCQLRMITTSTTPIDPALQLLCQYEDLPTCLDRCLQ